MLVVLVVAGLAWHRFGSLSPRSTPDLKMASWPDPDELLKAQDDLSKRLSKLEESGGTSAAIIQRANVITKDMLEVKQVVADLREQVTLMRTKNSIRAVANQE